jgi:hypothetical protein
MEEQDEETERRRTGGGAKTMVGAMILAKAMPLWQAVSADLQQAIHDEVQQQLANRQFLFSPGREPWNSRAGVMAQFVPIALFAMVVLIVFVIARRRQAELRARAEFQKQILDKFSSGKEFADFLGTEGSQRFLESFSSHSFGSRERTLRGMRSGITIAVLGIGFLLLTPLRHGFVVPGVLFLALGAGLLISAAASYHFSKKWNGGGPATPGAPLSHS